MKSLQRFWHRHSPQLFLSELLEKRWMEPIIPFTLTIAVFLAFALTIPNYTSLGNLQQLMLNFAEQAMVAIAMAFPSFRAASIFPSAPSSPCRIFWPCTFI
jgi:ribose transport system permease protein